MNETLLMEAKPATLLDLLDRLLDKGVAISGRVLISIADIDLIYLNLKLLLSSVETVEREAEKQRSPPSLALRAGPSLALRAGPSLALRAGSRAIPRGHCESRPRGAGRSNLNRSGQVPQSQDEMARNDDPPRRRPRPLASNLQSPVSTILSSRTPSHASPGRKLRLDPEKTRHDMAKLLLTVTELLRRLMERQAIKRMDGGSLNAWQIEQLGQGLMALEHTMEDLKRSFGLQDEELNLDLGPLGELM